MKIEVQSAAPETLAATVLALPVMGGSASAELTRIDALLGGMLAALTASGEAKADAGSCTIVQIGKVEGVAATRVALVGLGSEGEIDDDAVRTGAAAAARAAKGLGGAVLWAFLEQLPLSPEQQIRAVVEGVLLGSHDPARWKTSARPAQAEGLVIAGAPSALERDGLEAVAERAAIVARWTNIARDLVDTPPNELTPAGLATAAKNLLEPLGVTVEVLDADGIEAAGLGALAVVGRGSVNPPRLIVLRYNGGAPGGSELLGLVGKSITYDSGGYFLKPQGDIVKQKADMGGGAAVLGAVGAIAELGLPLDLVAVLPAAENMIGGAAYRPSDIIKTAAGLTVEITNTDAEGRLVLADGLWYARQQGATRLVDLATLTGAMRGAMGDMYVGVFANDDDWRARVVAAGNESGDHAWPWPLARRYRRLLDSQLADLKNTSGRSFGYAIIAASFLERFVGDLPWAHIDIHSTAFLDEDRDYLAKGGSGAGVRLLTALATSLSEE